MGVWSGVVDLFTGKQSHIPHYTYGITKRNRITVRPETTKCHSEFFGKLRTAFAKRGTVILSRAKDLEILRRPAVGGTPQNDIQEHGLQTENI